jgi:hypothetical protein
MPDVRITCNSPAPAKGETAVAAMIIEVIGDYKERGQ